MRSRRPSIDSAVRWWIADALAAVLFATGLAGSIAALVDGTRPAVLAGIAMLVLAMIGRALAQTLAASAGFDRARLHKAALRAHLYPALLTTAAGLRRSLGEELATAVDHVEATEGYHARYMPLRRAAMLSPLIVATAILFASPIAAAIVLLTLIPFALGMALAGGAAGKAADRQLAALARLSGLFVDRIRALPLIVVFGAEDRVATQLEGAATELADRTLAVLRIAFVSGAIIEFFAALAVALVAVYCGFNLLGLLPFPVPETLTLQRALFALALAPEFYLPMRRLAAAYHDRQTGEAAQAAIDRSKAPDLEDVVHTGTNLEIRDAVITYADGTSIGPVSFTAGPGITAITGATGSGKSTLLHAIIGIVPLNAGTIAGNASPLGWSGQAVALIPGTIADNIALARADADQAAVRAAAQAAGLAPVIAARPDDLATILDHRGSGLSGGERRRIGLARAILRDAPLWLLDEPTADLDPDSARAIICLLTEAARSRTIIVATHDPALIAAAGQRIGMP